MGIGGGIYILVNKDATRCDSNAKQKWYRSGLRSELAITRRLGDMYVRVWKDKKGEGPSPRTVVTSPIPYKRLECC